MSRFLTAFLLIAITYASASPQIFPIRVIYFRVYSPPPLTFQARLGGGFRAYLPDDCGVESFEFKCRKNRGDEWKGGNVTMKMGDHWIYEDPKLRLNPGERLYYTGTVMNRGKPFPLHQDAEWIVPEKLPSAFTPPVVKERQCPEDAGEDRFGEPPKNNSTTTESTTEQPTSTSESTPMSTSAESTSPKLDTTSETSTKETATPKAETTTATTPKSETTTTESTTPKSEITTTESTKPKSESTTPSVETKSGCPWVDITPADTKEKTLQNSLGRIQCDLAAFALRTALLNEQLTQELIDLKKLNYATVARLQRLESLTRSLPRNLPYPF